jgi:DNA-binding NtrC family response regulator
LRKLERDFVLARLQACEWNVSDAAKAMEITRTALHNRLKKLGINSRELRQGGNGPDRRDGPSVLRKG